MRAAVRLRPFLSALTHSPSIAVRTTARLRLPVSTLRGMSATTTTGAAGAAELKAEAKSECCPTGSPGAAPKPTAYVPKGTKSVVGDGLPLYVTGDRSERGVVVIQEVYGIESGRLEQICDTIADAGFVVAMADYHRGENFGQMGGDWNKFGPWLAKTPLSKIDSDLNKYVFPALTAKGATKFGAVGFCFGSLIVMHLASNGRILAGASCHPSHGMLASKYGLDPHTLVADSKCPQLIYTAGNDAADQKPGGADDKSLRSKSYGTKNEFKNFKDEEHGWVTRGDFKAKPEIERDYKLAINGVISFLKANVV